MNNLSEEDSFAASNIEDEDITPEESLVNHAAARKKSQKKYHLPSNPPKTINERKIMKSP